MTKLVSRKTLHAYDKKCERLGKKAERYLSLSDKWRFDKANACPTEKCQERARRKSDMYEERARKYSYKQTECERFRPD